MYDAAPAVMDPITTCPSGINAVKLMTIRQKRVFGVSVRTCFDTVQATVNGEKTKTL